MLSLCRSALDGISVFSATLQPVLAAALSMGGSAVTATTLQVASMFAFDLVLRLIEGLLVPAVCVYLAVTVVDAAAGNGVLRGLAEGIGSLSAGALKLILTLFTAYLAVAGGVSGNVDRVALKTAEVRGLGRGSGGRRRHVGRGGDRSVGCRCCCAAQSAFSA
ncbi:MAG: stage III sporulation protein AE [Butyricicoccaceae bacterium]